MQVFTRFIQLIAGLPDFISLLLCPTLLFVWWGVCLARKRREQFTPVAYGLGALAFTLLCCEGEVGEAFVYLGLFALLALLLRGVLAVKRKPRKKRSREEEIYEKFHLELSPLPEEEARSIPKVCCFEEGELSCDAEESGVRLQHARALTEKLRAVKLAPADRLEVDVLSRRMESLANRRLTAEEVGALNDCLATVLRLTAKYSL